MNGGLNAPHRAGRARWCFPRPSVHFLYFHEGTYRPPPKFVHGNFCRTGKKNGKSTDCPDCGGRPNQSRTLFEDALKGRRVLKNRFIPRRRRLEEAVDLAKGTGHGFNRALVTDINLTGRMNGWGGSQNRPRQIDPTFPNRLHDGCCREMIGASHGVPNSLLLEKAVCPSPRLVTAVLFNFLKRSHLSSQS